MDENLGELIRLGASSEYSEKALVRPPEEWAMRHALVRPQIGIAAANYELRRAKPVCLCHWHVFRTSQARFGIMQENKWKPRIHIPLKPERL
jgi:hypothetical protein